MPMDQRPQNTRRPSASSAYRAQRKQTRRRRRNASLAVMAVLVVGLFVTALVVAGGLGAAPASSLPVISSVVPSSSAAVVASSVAPSSSAPARTPTIYDEEAMPPLFNFENYIPDEYTSAMKLVDVGDGHKMETRAAAAYLDMKAAAKADGINLVALSGYRTNERQTNNYNASIQRYMAQGLSRDKAVELTEGYYAIPGTSEHEAGLAMDIGDAAVPSANIQDSFESTEAFAWLQQHCTEYGFILRYKEENFDITRIHYEPWHYRYVGANHAEVIAQHDVTLEEYVSGVYVKEYDPASQPGSSASRGDSSVQSDSKTIG